CICRREVSTYKPRMESPLRHIHTVKHITRSSTDNRVMCFTVCICRRGDYMRGLYVETSLRFNCTGFLLSIILILREGCFMASFRVEKLPSLLNEEMYQ